MIKKLIYLCRTLTRGFSDEEIVNLNKTIATFIIPRLKRFKELDGYRPSCAVENIGELWKSLTTEEWHNKLDKMIIAFDYAKNKNSYLSKDLLLPTKEQQQRDEIRYAAYIEGMRLFNLYFEFLWT